MTDALQRVLNENGRELPDDANVSVRAGDLRQFANFWTDLRTGPWKCFHCGEICETIQAARDHFGTDDHDECACIERMEETDKALVEDRRHWKNRALAAEDAQEQAEYISSGFETELLFRFKVRTVNDAWHKFDEMKGRALAAETALDAAPRWLRTFLRKWAERLWKARR